LTAQVKRARGHADSRRTRLALSLKAIAKPRRHERSKGLIADLVQMIPVPRAVNDASLGGCAQRRRRVDEIDALRRADPRNHAIVLLIAGLFSTIAQFASFLLVESSRSISGFSCKTAFNSEL
jgi:hypothetical protein